MQIQEIMTGTPACCTPETSLRDVAAMMVQHDCGAVPVVRDDGHQKLIGMITDRDIVCRTLAEGKNPMEMTAGTCMTDTVVSITPEMNLEDCCRIMEQHQIRRIPVVDNFGVCRGIVSQADLAKHLPQQAGRIQGSVPADRNGCGA